MDRLLLFSNEQGFNKAVEYAHKKGYEWANATQYKPTYGIIKTSLPIAAKNYAIRLYYNNITKKHEMCWQTRAFYLGNNGRKNITKYIIEEF